MNVNYNFEIPPLNIREVFDKDKNQFRVTVDIKQSGLNLYYTTDDTEPNTKANKYENTFIIDKSSKIKFGLFRGEKKVGETTERSYSLSKANNKKVIFTYQPSNRFEGGNSSILTDGIQGGNNYRIGGYLGFQSTDFEAVIDLESEVNISKISIGFFTASSSLVLLPEFTEFFISEDGETFKSVGKLTKYFSLKDPSWKRIDFTTQFEDTKARHIKIFTKNPMQVPEWHPAFEGKVWLMVDEIIVE